MVAEGTKKAPVMKNLPAVPGSHLLFHTRAKFMSPALSISALLLRCEDRDTRAVRRLRCEGAVIGAEKNKLGDKRREINKSAGERCGTRLEYRGGMRHAESLPVKQHLSCSDSIANQWHVCLPSLQR